MTALRVFQALRSVAAKATETLRGVLRVGTQAEVVAGALDDVAVTPRKLRWGFSISLATNGYIILPTWLGGLIIQWFRATASSAGRQTTPLPLAFPTAQLFGVAVDLGSDTTGAVAGSWDFLLSNKTQFVSYWATNASDFGGLSIGY
ncbi:gp53-like domain-containing protein [Stutzerimonas stutzeri]|uniref:gp53-like domain-containing protein n=1 Tax=Stutzerimonas stutzeri TaxID=316 RepID=UPI003AF377F8